MIFKNYPLRKEIKDYTEAIENYIINISQYEEVSSIYQIGNVGVAGISDIDIIVFLNDDQSCLNNYSVFNNVLKKHKYLFMHDVFIVPKSVGNKLHLITSIFEIKHLYGEKIKFIEFVDEEKNIESLILLNDVVTVSISHEYEYWLNQKEIDLRLILARLNSLRYPVNMLNELAEVFKISLVNTQEYYEFIDDFSSFRRSFFDYSKIEAEDKTLYFLNRAKALCPLIINDLTLINEKTSFFSNFIDACDFNYYNNKLSLTSPDTSILVNLNGYIKTEGIISNSIKENYSYKGTVEFGDNYLNLLNQRIIALNKCMKFRHVNKISFGELWPLGFIEKISFMKRIKRKIKSLINF
jgi:hypothetical protein